VICGLDREGLSDAAVVAEVYRRGDNDEKCALLRALSLLSCASELVPVAAMGCRSHVLPVFEAIACDNDFPARYFDDSHFNQMVLKALFVGLPLGRIRNLAARRNGELGRMASAYASERRAAGRPVPEDIHLAGGE
jgi:hypothetical protein